MRPARAAPRKGLRDAMAALGGLQRNESAGHIDELGQKAQQLADRARQQQEQLKDMIGHPNAVGRNGRPLPTPEDMIRSRQQLADDVGHLEQSLRDAERAALKGNHEAAAKLRDALNDLDEADVKPAYSAAPISCVVATTPQATPRKATFPMRWRSWVSRYARPVAPRAMDRAPMRH